MGSDSKPKSKLRTAFETFVRGLGLDPYPIVQFLRFNAAGLINGPFFYVLYEALYALKLHPVYPAETAWVCAYIVGCTEAHFVHYMWTFRSKRNYSQSLWRTLSVYAVTLTLSTISEYYLVSHHGFHHRLAWFLNASFFGFFTFLALRRFAFVDVESDDPQPAGKDA